jgi:hypothetical protein
MYRETVDFWLPDNQAQEGPQLARQMYDMLVTIYSSLFRPSSPLTLNWLVDDVYAMFGRDCNVMKGMGMLKTEFALFGKFMTRRKSS